MNTFDNNLNCRWRFPAALLMVLLATPAARGEDPNFRVFDAFEKKFELDWVPVRHDETHVSLTKNPGKLTITTQAGTLGGDETKSSTGPAKNLYLIANPVKEGGDFVVTTCIESFNPTQKWQQAGLLIYDDDDNYLKCDMEWSGTAIRFKYLKEAARFRTIDTDKVVPSPERTWIRITKRDNVYERSYSTDGKEYVSAGEKTWGNGDPQWIGLVAKNGGSNASDIDANFDFFEVRGLTAAEQNDVRHVERKKLEGAWKVASCEINGKPLEHSPLSAFVFSGGNVSFTDKKQDLTVDYALDPTQDPKGFVMSAFSRQAKQPANGIYSLEGDTLMICLALQPNAPAPTELKTTEGDSGLLLTLKREPAEREPAERAPDKPSSE